jgi:hypothetical protein
MQGVVCLGLLFRGAQCAHPFCERKCANAAVGLKHLAALKTVKYRCVLDVIIDYCDVEIIIERCNAMDEFSRGCLGLVITLVGSRERF